MPRVRHHFWLIVLLGSLAAIRPFELPSARGADEVAPPQVSQGLVFLRSEHPVFIRLTVLIDGQELRASRDERFRKVFAELDTNKDGAIDQAERDAKPSALRSLGLREKWAELMPRLDKQPMDGKISPAELTAFAMEVFGAPVRLARRTSNARRNSQAVELFDLLDEDQNQQLSKSEFATIAKRLSKLDADGDDAYSVVEVEPFRNPFGMRQRTITVQPEDSPWLFAEMAAELVLKKFDLQSPTGSLNARELGVSAQVFATADSNHDGELNQAELQAWLPNAPPHYILTVDMPQQKRGQASLTWVDASSPPPKAKGRQRVALVKETETVMAGQPLELSVSASKASQRDNVAFYINAFRRADTDKNKYLNATEFATMNFPGGSFELVDADGNGEIHDNEIREALTLQAVADQGHVMLTYDSNEVSLFSILDANRDNRLSPRECQKAAESWQSFDHNQDGKLERLELTGKLRMAIELVKPALFQNLMPNGAMMAGDPSIREGTAGPVWFRGMDRNKDGDISRKEFIGSEDAFKKWDKDGDGLIGLSEAGQ